MSVIKGHDSLCKILMLDDLEHGSARQPRHYIAVSFGFYVTKHFMEPNRKALGDRAGATVVLELWIIAPRVVHHHPNFLLY